MHYSQHCLQLTGVIIDGCTFYSLNVKNSLFVSFSFSLVILCLLKWKRNCIEFDCGLIITLNIHSDCMDPSHTGVTLIFSVFIRLVRSVAEKSESGSSFFLTDYNLHPWSFGADTAILLTGNWMCKDSHDGVRASSETRRIWNVTVSGC